MWPKRVDHKLNSSVTALVPPGDPTQQVPVPGEKNDITQHTRYNNPMLVQCWASVEDGGPNIGPALG